MNIANFLQMFVSVACDLMSLAILLRVLMSWMPNHGGQIRFIIRDVTEPVLGIFRRIIPKVGMFDFTPIVAFIAIDFFKVIIIAIISSAFI